MLIALCDNRRIDAADALRENVHSCPNCGGEVILKCGQIVVAHFAHKPPTDCFWQEGETRAHLEAKKLVQESFRERGVRAEAEFVVETLVGDRRADVMVWTPSGKNRIAFELQHSSIDLKALEKRAWSYASAGIAQFWIPFVRKIVWKEGVRREERGWFVARYPATSFEKWVHGLNGKLGMWMYDPSDRAFWHARLAPHRSYVEETSWYSEGGEEQYGGGFWKTSKKFRELSLDGPYALADLKLKLEHRRQSSLSHYSWPSCNFARFVTSS